jgi:hypothetical protein
MLNWLLRTNQLDKPLFRWDKHNVLTVRDLVAGGIHAFGATGSGKTSSLMQLAVAIMAFGNSSMLILCSKRGEAQGWLRAAKRAGRKRDVILINPKQPARFNVFGYEAGRKGEGAGVALNVMRYIMQLRSVVFRESEQAGGDSQQWKQQDEQLITYCVIILIQAGEDITPANLHELILSAPVTAEQMLGEDWQQGYCNRCLAKAFHRKKSDIEQHDFKQASNFLTRFWPQLADKTRSSIMAGTMATLAVCNTGIARELFATSTTFTPASAIEGRKLVIVEMPPDEFGAVSAVANIGVKLHWQRDPRFAGLLYRLVFGKFPDATVEPDHIRGEAAQFARPCTGSSQCLQEDRKVPVCLGEDCLVLFGRDEFLATGNRWSFQAGKRRAGQFPFLDGPVEHAFQAGEGCTYGAVAPVVAARPDENLRGRNRDGFAWMMVAEIFEVTVIPVVGIGREDALMGRKELRADGRKGQGVGPGVPQFQHELVVKILSDPLVFFALNELSLSLPTVDADRAVPPAIEVAKPRCATQHDEPPDV